MDLIGLALSATLQTGLSAITNAKPTIEIHSISQSVASLQEQFPSLYVLDEEDVLIMGGRFPWSEVLILLDSFTGEERLAIFDKNYNSGYVGLSQAEIGFFSAWRQDRVYFAEYGIVVGREEAISPAMTAQIKIGSEIFSLNTIEGAVPGLFFLDSEVQQALINADGNIQVRTSNINGVESTFEVGGGTISAYEELTNLLSTVQ